MGNACGCGGDTGPEKPTTQTDGELAGKAKFLSTPSFCEFSDPTNILGAVVAASTAAAANSSTASPSSAATSTAAGSLGLGREESVSVPTGKGVVSSAHAAKWFLCVFAPLNGQGLSFTAYHSKTNTLMTKYLTDSEIVKEKEAQNISITYNMFFKALSTEVARAGRVGAKVSFVDTNTIALDCKIMIAGATSRRPDNFHVDLKRVVDPSPDKLYAFVVEPVCTQYYKRRANEGWNVERVDVSREKIYGEYETNFILRSHRLERNLDMLRELVPRVLQLRRERVALRARRDALLAQLCVTRTMLASTEPRPERLVDATVQATTICPKQRKSAVPQQNGNTRPSSIDALYPTVNDAEVNIKLPRGIFLSSNMPNKHAPLPDKLPYKGTSSGLDAGGKSGSGGGKGASDAADDILLGGGGATTEAGTPKPRENHYISQKALELCIKLGQRVDQDLRAFEKAHPPSVGKGTYASATPPLNGRMGSIMMNDSITGWTPHGSGIYGSSAPSPGHSNNALGDSLNNSPSPNRGGDGANNLPGQVPDSAVGNDSLSGRDVFDGQSFALPSEDYFIYDYAHFPSDIQKRFATLPGGEEERCAVFRCWRSFISVSRFDALILETMSGGHALSIVLTMALSHHNVIDDLDLCIDAVHDLCTRLEALHSRHDVFYNSARAADRVQFMSLFLKVIQSGEVPRLSGLPAIEKLCVLVAAAACRVDLHPPQEPFSLPATTLAALHIDSVNERHSLAVTVDALRQHPGIAKFITPNVHALLSDFFLSLDPSRHGAILTTFLLKIRAATNFSRSLVERRLMLSVLLVGADCAFFARTPHVKDQWMRRLDSVGGAGRFVPVRLKSFNMGSKGDAGGGGGGDQQGSPVDASLTELRSPLKINLPSTFRIGAASGFAGGGGGGGQTAAQDDVSASCLVLRSETLAGGVGKSIAFPGAPATQAVPACMQGITKKSHEVYEGIVTPVFSCLRTLAQEALDAARRAQNVGSSETARDATYSVFARIAQTQLYA